MGKVSSSKEIIAVLHRFARTTSKYAGEISGRVRI